MCKLEDELNEVAQEIAEDYGYPVPIVVLTIRFKRKWGNCNVVTKVITLNRHFCENNTFEAVYDLIKHEIAHLRAPNHGPEFVRACAEMGIPYHTDILHPDCVTEKGKFVYMCPGCGEFFYSFRKWKRSKSCADCSGGYYNPKFKLIDVTA